MTVKVVAISTEDDAAARYLTAKSHGYVTFIYEHADPLHSLSSEKFIYVKSDAELSEKLKLLYADHTVVDELMRL